MRSRIVVVLCLVILVVTHHVIYSRERLLMGGRVVMLRLAPTNLSPLIQGKCLYVRFEIENVLLASIDTSNEENDQGFVILTIDQNGIAVFDRLDDGSTLTDTEVRMRYRIRKGQVKLVNGAFLLRESAGTHYSAAVFGEFRVGQEGESMLTHLRDGNMRRLGNDDTQ